METNNRDRGIDCRILSNIRFNARRLARDHTIPGMEIEDYEQDLVLDLLHRRKAFDPTRASFATFADRVVGHRISTLASPTLRLRTERKAISLHTTTTVDGDDTERPLLDHLSDGEALIDERTAIKIDVSRFVERLSPPLRQCCEILLADSVSEGARAAGVHRSTVYERTARLRERALAHGLGVYVVGYPDTFARPRVDDEDQPGSPASAFDLERHLTMDARPKFPTVHLSLSEVDLCGWLGQAEPGDTLEYFRGHLVVDANPHGSRLPERDRAELGRTARRAFWSWEHGLVHLVQRHHGPDDYSYLLVARPRSPSQPLSELLTTEVA